MQGIRKNAVGMGALVIALGVWGCSDDPTGPDPDEDPSFTTTAAVSSTPAQIVGGGRVDYPPGSAQKNTPQQKRYQTWGVNLHADLSGGFQFVDHRPELRDQCGGRPCAFHSVRIDSYGPTDNSCADGGVQVRGIVREKHTQTDYEFRLDVCDNGEPGHKNPPRDRLELCIRPFSDGLGGQCTYHVRELPTEVGAQLTGGNTQARR